MSQKPIWENLGPVCWLVGTDTVTTMVPFSGTSKNEKERLPNESQNFNDYPCFYPLIGYSRLCESL